MLNSYRKSSQIWNLCRGNKYPLKVLLVVHILWLVEAILKIRRPVKNTDWKTLTGRQAPAWEILCTYSGSYLACVRACIKAYAAVSTHFNVPCFFHSALSCGYCITGKNSDKRGLYWWQCKKQFSLLRPYKLVLISRLSLIRSLI